MGFMGASFGILLNKYFLLYGLPSSLGQNSFLLHNYWCLIFIINRFWNWKLKLVNVKKLLLFELRWNSKNVSTFTNFCLVQKRGESVFQLIVSLQYSLIIRIHLLSFFWSNIRGESVVVLYLFSVMSLIRAYTNFQSYNFMSVRNVIKYDRRK